MFFSQLFIKMSPEARQWISLLIQLLFLPKQEHSGLLLEGCSKTAGLLAFKLFLHLKGFVLSTKMQIQRSFMELKSSIYLITSLHWGLKHLHWSKTKCKQLFQTSTCKHQRWAEHLLSRCCGSTKGFVNSPNPSELKWVKAVKQVRVKTVCTWLSLGRWLGQNTSSEIFSQGLAAQLPLRQEGTGKEFKPRVSCICAAPGDKKKNSSKPARLPPSFHPSVLPNTRAACAQVSKHSLRECKSPLQLTGLLQGTAQPWICHELAGCTRM